MTSPLLKAFLLVFAAISHYVGLKSPNPPPSKEERVHTSHFFEKLIPLLPLASRISTIMVLICECAVILSLYSPTPYSKHILNNICPYPSPGVHNNIFTLSPSFLIGIGIMVSSAALRVWCFRTLGSLFTFEVSIKPGHRLIESGPYSYVRHPSYTGCVFMLLGAALTGFASGSFINECHIMLTPAQWPIRLWLGVAVFSSISLRRRGKFEDERLRQEFGVAWDRYRQAVPHMFIPYLF
ncbi:ICMT-domain-containing protein [Ramaria rubella]|nr:ICMT-domain-containing protein [Ramaria rubella]